MRPMAEAARCCGAAAPDAMRQMLLATSSSCLFWSQDAQKSIWYPGRPHPCPPFVLPAQKAVTWARRWASAAAAAPTLSGRADKQPVPSTATHVPMGCAAAQKAVDMGATLGINSRSSADAIEAVLHVTNRKGVDVAIEAVGLPTTFKLCQARAPMHPFISHLQSAAKCC